VQTGREDADKRLIILFFYLLLIWLTLKASRRKWVNKHLSDLRRLAFTSKTDQNRRELCWSIRPSTDVEMKTLFCHVFCLFPFLFLSNLAHVASTPKQLCFLLVFVLESLYILQFSQNKEKEIQQGTFIFS
jgi:hypothetical protein